ncbi:MAG: DUF711 family protein [Candidatus Acidiferrales bacterium]|jgi:hypothetical protein
MSPHAFSRISFRAWPRSVAAAIALITFFGTAALTAHAQTRPQVQQRPPSQVRPRAAAPVPASADKPKIRAITAFINLDRANYRQQIADAVKMLKYARTVFDTRGYPVQSIRISTQPFPQYTAGMTAPQAIAFFKDLDALAQTNGFDASIGPALLNANDDPAQAVLLGEILRNTKVLNGSIAVAGEDGVRWKAVGAAARLVKELESTERGQGNFRFAAISLVPPLTPFYPASYHTGFGHQFAIALQSANTVDAAFHGAPDLEAARRRLIDSLGAAAFEVQALAGRVDRETGWAYSGIDLSPAPLKDVSIGAAMEEITQMPIGESGTLTAAALITSALRDIAVEKVGYSGLMLPVLEDARLAQRWSEGRLTLDSLLAYSAVCGTGLDTVPLPGDISEERLALIIGDMASLSVKWRKPLTARLMPIAGKGPGDRTEFDDPFLVNAVIQPLAPVAKTP